MRLPSMLIRVNVSSRARSSRLSVRMFSFAFASMVRSFAIWMAASVSWSAVRLRVMVEGLFVCSSMSWALIAFGVSRVRVVFFWRLNDSVLISKLLVLIFEFGSLMVIEPDSK